MKPSKPHKSSGSIINCDGTSCSVHADGSWDGNCAWGGGGGGVTGQRKRSVWGVGGWGGARGGTEDLLQPSHNKVLPRLLQTRGHRENNTFSHQQTVSVWFLLLIFRILLWKSFIRFNWSSLFIGLFISVITTNQIRVSELAAQFCFANVANYQETQSSDSSLK